MQETRDSYGQYSRPLWRQVFSRKTLVLFWVGSFITTMALFSYFTLLAMPYYLFSPISSVMAKSGATESIKDYVLGEVRANGIDEYRVWALLSLCENRDWNTEAAYVNKDLSIDRGLFQINSKYHSEVSNSCAYDYRCATREAIRILKDRGFEEWTCGDRLGL